MNEQDHGTVNDQDLWIEGWGDIKWPDTVPWIGDWGG